MGLEAHDKSWNVYSGANTISLAKHHYTHVQAHLNLIYELKKLRESYCITRCLVHNTLYVGLSATSYALFDYSALFSSSLSLP